MRVVLDSNVFVSCLNSFSPHHYVFQSLVNGKFAIAISTDTAFEYEEVFCRKFSKSKSDIFFYFIKTSGNIIETEIYYKWNLITVDPDDNKLLIAPSQLMQTISLPTTNISTFLKRLTSLK